MQIRLFFGMVVIVGCISQHLRQDNPEKIIKVAIIATNDLHGGVFPLILSRADTGQRYKQGGLTVLGSMIEGIREEFGKGNVLFLDSGDQFQGGIEASRLVSNGSIINDFFNQMELSASTIGNHEFDLGPDFLKQFMKDRKSPFLVANLFSENGEPASTFLPNTENSHLFEMENGVKIGVIGLVTKLTPQTTMGFVDHSFPQYQFRGYSQIVKDQAAALRARGANAVILLAHIGTRCPGTSSKMKNVTANTRQGLCNHDEVTKLIDQLPDGTIDGVVQGHRHQTVHHYYQGVPIAGTKSGGLFFNLLHFNFNLDTKKLVSTLIEGPIPICLRVFEFTNGCEYVSPELLPTVGQLVSWKFHGRKVISSPKLETVFQKWRQQMQPFLADLVENTVFLQKVKQNESELANLFADLLIRAADFKNRTEQRPDFALMNVGTMRTNWSPGILLERDMYNMIPFDNQIVAFNISGSKLKELIKRIYWGGWTYGISGLRLKMTRKPYQVVQCTQDDGNQLDPNKIYTGVTTDFLLSGGDGFQHVVGQLYNPAHHEVVGSLRDSIRRELIKLRKILPGWVDPLNPRIQFLDQSHS